ncbi:hypothetical protein D3C76_822750 [compost metagenome]
MGLQAVENVSGQGPAVDQHVPVNAGAWAEHQIAHIIASDVDRPQPDSQQPLDQRGGLLANSANLQIGAVGRLYHATGIAFGGISHRHGLICTNSPAGKFDPTNTAIQRLHDTQQTGTGRWAQGTGCLR